MNKQELIGLVGKGYVKVGEAEIEVTLSKVIGSDYIHITQKALNEHTTDHEFSGGFVEYLKDEDIQELEPAILKVHNKMLDQTEICKKEPLALTTIKGTDFLKSSDGKKYLKSIPSNDKNFFVLYVTSNGEADYSINKPVLIDDKFYTPMWSWWLDQGCYIINNDK